MSITGNGRLPTGRTVQSLIDRCNHPRVQSNVTLLLYSSNGDDLMSHVCLKEVKLESIDFGQKGEKSKVKG